MVREIIKADTLPDYELFEEHGDIIAVTPREQGLVDAQDLPGLSQAALEEARRIAPGMDVYALEAEWRSYWVKSGRKRLGSADRAFLGWVQKTRQPEST